MVFKRRIFRRLLKNTPSSKLIFEKLCKSDFLKQDLPFRETISTPKLMWHFVALRNFP